MVISELFKTDNDVLFSKYSCMYLKEQKKFTRNLLLLTKKNISQLFLLSFYKVLDYTSFNFHRFNFKLQKSD